MAVWQLDLQLVPRASLARSGVEAGGHLSPNQFDAGDWWRNYELPSDFTQRFSAVLPRATSWEQGWQVYGREDGDRIDVFTTSGGVEEVRARVDARSLDASFIERLVRLARELDVLFISPELHVIEPEVEAVWVELQLSPAAQFVHDPETFLAQLRDRRADTA